MRLTALSLIAVISIGCASSGAYHTAQVSFVAGTAADVVTTRMALNAGAVEKNPLVPENLAGLLLMKTGTGIAALWAASELGKRGHRGIGTAILAAAATVYGVVAYRNYQIARGR